MDNKNSRENIIAIDITKKSSKERLNARSYINKLSGMAKEDRDAVITPIKYSEELLDAIVLNAAKEIVSYGGEILNRLMAIYHTDSKSFDGLKPKESLIVLMKDIEVFDCVYAVLAEGAKENSIWKGKIAEIYTEQAIALFDSGAKEILRRAEEDKGLFAPKEVTKVVGMGTGYLVDYYIDEIATKYFRFTRYILSFNIPETNWVRLMLSSSQGERTLPFFMVGIKGQDNICMSDAVYVAKWFKEHSNLKKFEEILIEVKNIITAEKIIGSPENMNQEGRRAFLVQACEPSEDSEGTPFEKKNMVEMDATEHIRDVFYNAFMFIRDEMFCKGVDASKLLVQYPLSSKEIRRLIVEADISTEYILNILGKDGNDQDTYVKVFSLKVFDLLFEECLLKTIVYRTTIERNNNKKDSATKQSFEENLHNESYSEIITHLKEEVAKEKKLVTELQKKLSEREQRAKEQEKIIKNLEKTAADIKEKQKNDQKDDLEVKEPSNSEIEDTDEEIYENYLTDEEASEYVDEILMENTVLVLGARKPFQDKLIDKSKNLKFVSYDDFKESHLNKTDMAYLKTDYCSHTKYSFAKSKVKLKGIPFRHSGLGERSVRNLYDAIIDMYENNL